MSFALSSAMQNTIVQQSGTNVHRKATNEDIAGHLTLFFLLLDRSFGNI